MGLEKLGLIYPSCVETCTDLSAEIMVRNDHGHGMRVIYGKLHIWPIPVDDSAGLDICGGLKPSPTIEINKDALFRSIKTGVEGAQNAVWRMMTAAGAASPWTSGRAAAMTLCCTRPRVRALLKRHCCSVEGSPVIKSSVNDHEKNLKCIL